MHLGIPALLNYYRRHREEESLVLATIIGTRGSTYRKPGAMMLIGRDGTFAGMISGGCLEGDLLHHAGEVFQCGEPRFITYDMHADENLVWNLGLGCDGVIHLLLQRLGREDGFGFLRQLADSQGALRAAVLGLVTSGCGDLGPGDFALLDRSGLAIGDRRISKFLREQTADWPDWRFRNTSMAGFRSEVESHPGPEVEPMGAKAAAEAEIMMIHMPAPTRVLICGAGPDAVPVAQAFSELEWGVLVADHRPAFAKADRFPPGTRVIRSRPEKLREAADLSGVDAAVIMSHHLENDAAYLEQLSDCSLSYLGVLGPAARRNRLCEMAQCDPGRVRGPVGLDIGAELPAAIALSVAAEVHAVLNHRDGRSLTLRVSDGAA